MPRAATSNAAAAISCVSYAPKRLLLPRCFISACHLPAARSDMPLYFFAPVLESAADDASADDASADASAAATLADGRRCLPPLRVDDMAPSQGL